MFQLSVAVRNARLDAIEQTIGAAPTLKVFSGAEPADCTQPDPSGLLLTMTLPADWLAPASGGSKSKLGTWSGAASVTGKAASWRIYGGLTCHMQGNTADMVFDNVNFTASQVVTVTSFVLTGGNG